MPQNVLKSIPSLWAYVHKLEWSASSETHFAHTPMFGGCKVPPVSYPWIGYRSSLAHEVGCLDAMPEYTAKYLLFPNPQPGSFSSQLPNAYIAVSGAPNDTDVEEHRYETLIYEGEASAVRLLCIQRNQQQYVFGSVLFPSQFHCMPC